MTWAALIIPTKESARKWTAFCLADSNDNRRDMLCDSSVIVQFVLIPLQNKILRSQDELDEAVHKVRQAAAVREAVLQAEIDRLTAALAELQAKSAGQALEKRRDAREESEAEASTRSCR